MDRQQRRGSCVTLASKRRERHSSTASANSLLCAIVFCAFSACPTALAYEWGGRYAYDATFGTSYGGSPIQAHYEILLDEQQHSCEILITGYQTDEDILCTTRKEQNTIYLLFKSYSTGQIANLYGVEIYKQGQPLLALERRPDGNAAEPTTRWLAMKGLDGKRPKAGIYFKMAKHS